MILEAHGSRLPSRLAPLVDEVLAGQYPTLDEQRLILASVERLPKEALVRDDLDSLVRAIEAAVATVSDVAGDRLMAHTPGATLTATERHTLQAARNTNRQYEYHQARIASVPDRDAYLASLCYRSQRTMLAAVRVGLKRRARELISIVRNPRDDLQLIDAIWSLRHAQDELRWVDSVPRSEMPSRRGARKSGLGSYGHNVVDACFRAIRPTSKFGLPMAVVMSAGARPIDLVRGVDIRPLGKHRLSFTFRGTKLSLDRGQPERALVVNVANAATRFLHDRATQWRKAHAARRVAGFPRDPSYRGQLTVKIQFAWQLRDAFLRLGKRAFPHRLRRLKPYDFRHEFATAMRSQGRLVECAEALGHRSVATTTGYGTRRRYPRGGFANVAKTTATFHVRRAERAAARPEGANRLRKPGPSQTQPFFRRRAGRAE